MIEEGAGPLERGASRWPGYERFHVVRNSFHRMGADRGGLLLIGAVGVATLVLGLGAGALLNLYLVATNDPLVHELRTVLSFKSAILGDGLVLPLVNMLATAYILKHRQRVSRYLVFAAVTFGSVVTAYVHVIQATNDLVNWSMPTAWHWNGVGLLHAVYMLAVVSLLWLFLLVVIKVAERPTAVPREASLVVAGVIFFLFLLRTDYLSAQLNWLPTLQGGYRERASLAIAASLEAIGVATR